MSVLTGYRPGLMAFARRPDDGANTLMAWRVAKARAIGARIDAAGLWTMAVIRHTYHPDYRSRETEMAAEAVRGGMSLDEIEDGALLRITAERAAKHAHKRAHRPWWMFW